MSKKNGIQIGTTDNGNEDDFFTHRQLNGFWQLVSIHVTPYKNSKKMNPVFRKIIPPKSMLIELSLQRITWNPLFKEQVSYPLQLHQNKLLTHDLYSGQPIIVKTIIEGNSMQWIYTLDGEKENYSCFILSFIREQ
jgi:hypothetical protein